MLSLFTSDASIDDVSVGEKFEQIPGIKKYFVTYFIGYQTSTRVLSLVHNEGQPIVARVDFTGDFGHETGALEFQVNEAGLIEYVQAYLD